MLYAAIIAVVVSMGLLLVRGILGPTMFDRVLVMNNVGTNIVVFIALLGQIFNTEFYIDIALTYALINFVATVAVLRYFENRPFTQD